MQKNELLKKNGSVVRILAADGDEVLCFACEGMKASMPRWCKSIELEDYEPCSEEEFLSFCDILFSYQYVQKRSQLSDNILEWLYEHSGAIPGTIMALIHDAQEIAILGERKNCVLQH